MFGIFTTLVALFKHETDESYDPNEPHFSLLETYKILIKVLRLPAVRSMAMILLTIKVSSRNQYLLSFFFRKFFR
jgi:hypothetical protein